jgi:hypothetical protein
MDAEAATAVSAVIGRTAATQYYRLFIAPGLQNIASLVSVDRMNCLFFDFKNIKNINNNPKGR